MNNITLSGKCRPIKPRSPLFEGLVELGRVTAGIPLEAIEDRKRNELLSLLTAPGRYALQVSDDSMCEAGIIQGDILVVQSQQQARNGDIVVALIDNEQVTLKRIRYRSGNRIQLLADSPDLGDLILADSRVIIQGKVIGQIRQYR
jgi:repressor LexA